MRDPRFRYRQRVRFVPGRLANPVWIDDERFDVTYHVRRSALPRPGGDEQLEHIVERGGVGLAGLHEREELLEVVAEEGRGERRLARGKRVEVALERVDLAVVGKGAEGLEV